MTNVKRRGKHNSPTAAELEILNVLWQHQPATVREVHECLQRNGANAYTTTLKTMQIMHEKGLVVRDESSRAHIYRARYSQAEMQSTMVDDFVSKAFGGSRFDLVVRALGEKTSQTEIDELKALLDNLEKRNQ